MSDGGQWPGAWRREDLARCSFDAVVEIALALQAECDRQRLYSREHLCALGRMGVELAGVRLELEDALCELAAYRTGERTPCR